MAQNPGRHHDAEPRAHRGLRALGAERVVARRGRRLRGVEVERHLLVGWVTRSGARGRRRRQPTSVPSVGHGRMLCARCSIAFSFLASEGRSRPNSPATRPRCR